MKPRLQVMDAIIGMEGDGPHAGSPRKIGAVLTSGDYSAIDVATAKLMSIDPKKVPTIRQRSKESTLKEDLSDISIVGVPLESLVVHDYKGPSTHDNNRVLSFIHLIVPHILVDRCIGCMKCMRSCPVKVDHRGR